ncbi:MAG: hypothetical protein ACTSRL_04000 [Candidatus Helarchaeota archaeon]
MGFRRDCSIVLAYLICSLGGFWGMALLFSPAFLSLWGFIFIFLNTGGYAAICLKLKLNQPQYFIGIKACLLSLLGGLLLPYYMVAPFGLPTPPSPAPIPPFSIWELFGGLLLLYGVVDLFLLVKLHAANARGVEEEELDWQKI